MKTFAVITLVLSGLSIVVPVIGVYLSMVCSAMAYISFRRQPLLSGMTLILNIVGTAFLSPSASVTITPETTDSFRLGYVIYHVVFLIFSVARVLRKELWWAVFPPHEIKTCKVMVKTFLDEYEGNMGKNTVERMALEALDNIPKTLYAIRTERAPIPDHVVLVILKAAETALVYCQLPKFQGGLDILGEDIRSIWLAILAKGVETGAINAKDAEDYQAAVEQGIVNGTLVT